MGCICVGCSVMQPTKQRAETGQKAASLRPGPVGQAQRMPETDAAYQTRLYFSLDQNKITPKVGALNYFPIVCMESVVPTRCWKEIAQGTSV